LLPPPLLQVTGHHEIVSLTGTLACSGDVHVHASGGGTESSVLAHVHVALTDGRGTAIGGHLAVGSCVYTTAEITLLEAPGLVFERPVDPATGWDELAVIER
jgi:uncharacterized protein